MQLFLGTQNSGKIIEISECLAHVPIEIITPSMIQLKVEEPKEAGATFAENALQKAAYYFDLVSWATIADDSGIVVEALKGELGIRTRRWGAGPAASDKDWIEFFLERMRKEENKRARFICAIAYIDDEGCAYAFDGVCNGTITDTLEAEYLPGLPISACFKPNGFDKVYSAMTVNEKNAISHRGKALHKVRMHLLSENR